MKNQIPDHRSSPNPNANPNGGGMNTDIYTILQMNKQTSRRISEDLRSEEHANAQPVEIARGSDWRTCKSLEPPSHLRQWVGDSVSIGRLWLQPPKVESSGERVVGPETPNTSPSEAVVSSPCLPIRFHWNRGSILHCNSMLPELLSLYRY